MTHVPGILVGQKAPDFIAPAVLADGTIQSDFQLSTLLAGKQYGLIFFYPLDFTFVCPTELIELDRRILDFQTRNVQVIAVSIDSQFTHSAWRNTPRAKGGIGPVQYPLVADISHEICQKYGVEHPVAKIAFRGAFIVDRDQVVRAQIVNDLPLGRNIAECLRLVDALQHHEKHGEVCPVNWEPGRRAMTATAVGVSEYLSEHVE